jgi:membrane peptidoglycan carboxypeptidase
VLRRRNQTLILMEANGFISPDRAAQAKGRALQIVRRDTRQALQAPAVVEHVLEELTARHAGLSVQDLLQGRIHVYAMADARAGDFTPDGQARPLKWISNYDGRFKGLIPMRQALAESRNAVAIVPPRSRSSRKACSPAACSNEQTPTLGNPNTGHATHPFATDPEP